jgi:glyoxylase-like metal-dependent hydrolase (beta-lactamase superfamily II)
MKHELLSTVRKMVSSHDFEYMQVTPNIITTALYPREPDMKLLRTFETSTMSCVALPDELYFIDCGAITADAKKFRSDMEKSFDRPATHLLLTHDHWHSCWGMGAFEDVKIVINSKGKGYYHKNLKKGVYQDYKERIIAAMPDDERLKEALLDVTLSVPGTGVTKEKIFGPPANQIIFKSFFGHSSASAMIHVPSEKTLFAGGNLNTCYTQMVWPVKTIDLYREWENMEDIEHVVPGHGSVVNKEYITLIRIWFEELMDVLHELKKQGVTKREVTEHDLIPEYPGKKQKSWVEGSGYHTGAVNSLVKYWYGRQQKMTDEEDLMFIS